MTAASINLRDIPCERREHCCIFPDVVTVDTRGRERIWAVRVELFILEGDAFVPLRITDAHYDNAPIAAGKALIITTSGIRDGKVMESAATELALGKNLGKKNQTNAFTQALRDAYGLYMKHRKSHTHTASELSADISAMIPPMLLKVYALVKPVDGEYEMKTVKGAVAIDFEAARVFVQPKIDDVRVMATLDKGAVVLYSRKLTAITGFSKVRAAIQRAYDCANRLGLGEGLHFDGGFYKHGIRLQDINSIVRNVSNREREDELQFVVFDCFNANRLDEPFNARWEKLERIMEGVSIDSPMTLIETHRVSSHAAVIRAFRGFIDYGFEGAIIRKSDGVYTPGFNNRRSADVLKLKPRLDAEYRVLGFTEGAKGKDKGAIIWVLVTADGKEFNVVPNMPLEERYALYKRMRREEGAFESEYKDKFMTIEYDDVSKDDVPLRAKALRIRDDY